jgi:hypothetical protein
MEENGIQLDLSILDQLSIPEYKPNSAEGSGKKGENQIHQEKRETQESIQELESDLEESDDTIRTVASLAELEGNDVNEEDEEVSPQEEGLTEVEDSPIKVWAEFCSERGLIDIEDGEEVGDSEEYLITKFNQKVDKVVKNYKENLPAPIKELLDAYEQGIPVDELMEREARIAEFSQIDKEKLAEDVSLQKELVKSYLRSQDYEEDEIQSKIEKYEDNLMLEGEAAFALKKLVKLEQQEKAYMVEQTKKAQEAQMKQYQERVDNFKKSVMDKEEIIAGIPLTKEQKEKIINMTTKPVSMLKDGTPVTALKKMELEDPDFLTKLAYVAGVLNWDLSTVERKAATKAARQVKAKVNTYKESTLGKLDLSTIKKAVKINQQSLFR